MKSRTLITILAGAALLSTSAYADGWRVSVGYNGGGYYGGSCNTPVVYNRGYATPYYAPRTVYYNAPVRTYYGGGYCAPPVYRAPVRSYCAPRSYYYQRPAYRHGRVGVYYRR